MRTQHDHKVLPRHLLAIVTTLAPNSQLRVSDQLHSDWPPRTFLDKTFRAIADAVHGAEVAYDLLVDAVKIFYFSGVIDLIAAFKSQHSKLLPGQDVGLFKVAVLVLLFLSVEINWQHNSV